MKGEEMFAGFSVAAGDDRFGEHITLGGEPIDCKLSGRDTGGSMCVFEFTGHGGGPRHLHFDQDEWIYVVDGELECHVGENAHAFAAGRECIHSARVAHVWGCLSSKAGKIIDVYQPAAKMEEFFREVGKYDGRPAIHEVLGREGLHRLFESYGMDLLGPPLGWDEEEGGGEGRK